MARFISEFEHGPHSDFILKETNVVQSIGFATHAMRLESLGAFVCQCVLSIGRACFLKQAGRCVVL